MVVRTVPGRLGGEAGAEIIPSLSHATHVSANHFALGV